MENVWAEMVRRVYRNGQQYDTVAELREAILLAWDFIDFDYMADLINSMKERVYKTILARGGHSGY